jgi:Spy/CpxP family protein refolding chaperone
MTSAQTQAPPWQNLRVLSTLALVFLAGAASGALSMQFGLHDKMHRAIATPSSSVAAPTQKTMLERFDSELALSPEQSHQIAGVLADYTQYYQSLQDQLDDLRATGRTQILQVLTPDQRNKFEKMGTDLEVPAK